MKQAILLLSILLAGCGTVPHVTVVEQPADLKSEAPLSVELVPELRLFAAPAPAPAVPKLDTEELLDAIKLGHLREDLLATSGSPVVIIKTKTTTTNSRNNGKITVTVEETIVTPLALPNTPVTNTHWFKNLLDNLTKLIALLTGTLGLYVGVQKLRQPINPATT